MLKATGCLRLQLMCRETSFSLLKSILKAYIKASPGKTSIHFSESKGKKDTFFTCKKMESKKKSLLLELQGFLLLNVLMLCMARKHITSVDWVVSIYVYTFTHPYVVH